MIKAFALCALFAAAVSATAPLPVVPGVCSPSGGVGIGCGFDASKLGQFGLDVNPAPSNPVKIEWCQPQCYEPGASSPECEYCVQPLPDYPDIEYKVPMNVFVEWSTSGGGCFRQHTNAKVEDYVEATASSAGGGGWFSSWSRVTEDFYGEYYKTDSSLSLETQHVIWASLILPTFATPSPSAEFQLTVDGLPKDYDYDTYKTNVIDQFGTHYMDRLQVGGAAVMTSYFHSCLLEQYGGQYIFKESSSSFFGIFSSGSSHRSGYNHTDEKYKQWSNNTMSLVGGNATAYGTLNSTNFLDSAQCEAWIDSIKTDMIPLFYSLQPIHSLVSDPVIAANINRSFVEYGASIKTYNENVVKGLIPQDPYKKPSWCKYAPHPPSSVAAVEPDSTDASLPSCPELPGEDSPSVEFKKWTDSFQRRRR